MERSVVRIHRTGGPEVLSFETETLPPPAEGEVRLRQTAVGLNFIDVYHRTGLYPLPLPAVLGREAAGTVEVVGSGVTALRPGMRVAYPMAGDAYATARNIRADHVVPLPDGIEDRQAAGMMLKGLTAWYLLRRTFPVTRGTSVETAEYRRILVGTDFSPGADKALRQAIALSAPGADIEVAHVWQYPPGTWGLGALADHTRAMDALRSALTAGATERGQKIQEQWKGCGRTVRFELLHGPAASVLTARAETTHRDLIAVSTHGYRGFRRLLLGSVAEATVRHAPCSVLAAHAEHPDR